MQRKIFVRRLLWIDGMFVIRCRIEFYDGRPVCLAYCGHVLSMARCLFRSGGNSLGQQGGADRGHLVARRDLLVGDHQDILRRHIEQSPRGFVPE